MAEQRSYSPTRYGLELNGVWMGFVESFEGGNATADVVVEAPGADGIARKHLADVKYEEIVLTCGASMQQSFYDSLTAALTVNPTRQNGAVVAYDNNFTERWRLNFSNAFVSEVSFPALDGSSKDAVTLCVKLTADYTRRDTTNTGKVAVTKSGALKAKNWLASKFRLNIDGLNCDRVSRVEAITVTRLFPQSSVGAVRGLQLVPGYLQASNLVIALGYVPNPTDFFDWHQSFTVDGNNDQKQEKNGTLELLAPNMKDVLFALQFNNLGIFRLAQIQGSADSILRIRAEMYCDQILFTTDSRALATTTVQPDTTNSASMGLSANGGQSGAATGGKSGAATETAGGGPAGAAGGAAGGGGAAADSKAGAVMGVAAGGQAGAAGGAAGGGQGGAAAGAASRDQFGAAGAAAGGPSGAGVAGGGQAGAAATGKQNQATPTARGVRNLNLMQRPLLIPRPSTLRFRNLSSAADK